MRTNARQVRQPLACPRSLAGARSTTETGPSLDAAPSHSRYGERGTIFQGGFAFLGGRGSHVWWIQYDNCAFFLSLHLYLSLSISPISLSLSLSPSPRSISLSLSLSLCLSLSFLHARPFSLFPLPPSPSDPTCNHFVSRRGPWRCAGDRQGALGLAHCAEET